MLSNLIQLNQHLKGDYTHHNKIALLKLITENSKSFEFITENINALEIGTLQCSTDDSIN